MPKKRPSLTPPPTAPGVRGIATVDEALAERAIGDFLTAFGHDLRDPTLAETPRRVVRAWRDALIDGTHQDPVLALGERVEVDHGGPVLALGIPYRSVCPHHLFPVEGKADVALLPGRASVGFGAVARLIDVLAHRLVLQETLTESIADALGSALAPRGLVVILEATHGCVGVLDPARAAVRFRTRAERGDPAALDALERALRG